MTVQDSVGDRHRTQTHFAKKNVTADAPSRPKSGQLPTVWEGDRFGDQNALPPFLPSSSSPPSLPSLQCSAGQSIKPDARSMTTGEADPGRQPCKKDRYTDECMPICHYTLVMSNSGAREAQANASAFQGGRGRAAKCQKLLRRGHSRWTRFPGRAETLGSRVHRR